MSLRTCLLFLLCMGTIAGLRADCASCKQYGFKYYCLGQYSGYCINDATYCPRAPDKC